MIAATHGPHTTLADFLEHQIENRQPSTNVAGLSRTAVSHLDRFHGRPVALGELSAKLIKSWMEWLGEEGLSVATIRNYRSNIRSQWLAAFERGYAPEVKPALWWERWSKRKRRLSGPGQELPDVNTIPTGEEMLIGDLMRLFVASHRRRVAESRARQSDYYLADFASKFGTYTIGQFRKGAVTKVEAWLDQHSGWKGCRLSVVAYVKQAFAWGSEAGRGCQGFYATSPVASMERPKQNVRTAYFTPEQVAAILGHGSQQFRTAFRVLLATGCRPAELIHLTAADVGRDEDGQLFWLVHHKTEKHTGQKRRIYLTEEAEQLTREAMEKYPSGPLFRSACNGVHDAPLSVMYLSHALRKVCRHRDCRALGLDEHRKSKRCNGTRIRLYVYVPYVCRHTFAVRLLSGFHKDAKGQPIILGYPEVAVYMGNSATMVEKVYGKLTTQTSFLSARLRGIPLDRSTSGQ